MFKVDQSLLRIHEVPPLQYLKSHITPFRVYDRHSTNPVLIEKKYID